MSYRHVLSPVKGMVTNKPPTFLEPEQSPNISGMYIAAGELSSDFGYSAYPVASTTGTNLVHGVPLKTTEFLQANGNIHLIALTTTNGYEYNTSTKTWDCITKGQTVDDCEVAWTASANVTSTADTTIKIRGSKAAKHVIAAGFTTGLASYYNVASPLNLSSETALHFWIYSTVAAASGDLKLRVSEEVAGGTGATYEDLVIPALTANTWTPICVDYGTPADLDAVLSVGLVVATDLGAMTVYLDDLRSVDRFTGTADNRFSVGVMNDTLIITNGINQPQKYLGVVATGFADLVTTLNAGTLSTSEIVLIAKDHVVFLNNTENGADAPQRASWGNIGQLEDYIGGTAGYQDLANDASWIVSAAQLSENKWIIYKEDSWVSMEWVGGHTPFRFTPMIFNKTVAGKDCTLSIEGFNAVISYDAINFYDGAYSVQRFDEDIINSFFNDLDQTYVGRSFILWNEQDSELQIFVPNSIAYPDVTYCYQVLTKSWFKRVRTVSGAGKYRTSSNLTIEDLVGTIGDQKFTFGSTLIKANTPIIIWCTPTDGIFREDLSTYNNGSSAIENIFETPDFAIKDKEGNYTFDTFRIDQLIFEASGISVTTEWSDDGGISWSPTEGGGANVVTLSTVVNTYQQDLDIVCQKIRFRFRNSSLSSGFKLRYYGFNIKERSTRK